MATLTLKGKTSPRLEKIRQVETSSQRRNRLAKALLTELQKNHPTVFNHASPVPMKIKIHKDIKNRYPDYPVKAISTAMHFWSKRKLYHAALVPGSSRFDLDANQEGEV